MMTIIPQNFICHLVLFVLFEKGGVEFFLQTLAIFEKLRIKTNIAHRVLPTYPPLLKRKTRLHQYGNGWIQNETMSSHLWLLCKQLHHFLSIYLIDFKSSNKIAS
jgi:hypothetical protein